MKAIKQKTTAFPVEGSCRKKFDDFLSILPSSPFAESKSNQSAVEFVRNTGVLSVQSFFRYVWGSLRPDQLRLLTRAEGLLCLLSKLVIRVPFC